MLQKIQTTIIGFDGSAATLFSAYDSDKQILAVSTILPYRRDRFSDSLIITNDKKLERDTLFTESDLKSAIDAFFIMSGGVALDGKSSRIVFGDKAARAMPSNAIEKNGMDESGVKYNINERVTCPQIATLATAWYCHNKADVNNSVLSFMDGLNEKMERLEIGGILTI